MHKRQLHFLSLTAKLQAHKLTTNSYHESQIREEQLRIKNDQLRIEKDQLQRRVEELQRQVEDSNRRSEDSIEELMTPTKELKGQKTKYSMWRVPWLRQDRA